MGFKFLSELLTADDSFTQTLRKLTSLMNLVLAPFAFAYGLYWCFLTFTNDVGETGKIAGAGSVIQGFLFILLGIIMAVNTYLVIKWKNVSDDHITLLLWLEIVPLVGLVINVPEFGTRPLLIWYSMVAVTTQSQHALLQSVISLIAQLVSSYNTAFLHAPNSFVLLTPGARIGGPPMEVLGEIAGSTVVANTIVAGVYLQGRVYAATFEQAKKGKEAQAAVDMSCQVVELLRMYDTEGVNNLLQQYQGSDVDPELLAQFQMMRKNLEDYRPHLPNYLFLGDDAETLDGDTGRVDQITPQSLAATPEAVAFSPPPGSSPGAHRASPTTTERDAANAYMLENFGGGNGGLNSGPNSVMASPRRESLNSRQGYRLPQVMSPNAGKISPQTPSSVPPPQSPRDSPLGSSNNSGGGNPVGGAVGRGSSKGISYAMIDYKHVWTPHGMDNLTDLVNCVYTNATATYGSVHSMVGDTIIVTWNVQNRVAQPEAKAAKFVCRIAEAGKKNDYTVSGAVCSGPARCNAITSVTKQSTTLVQVPWLGALHGCFALAQRYKAMIMDEATFGVANYDVECRAVDVVKYNERPEVGKLADPRLLLDGASHQIQMVNASAAAAASNQTLVMAYEAVEEFKHKEGEWMYQLQKNSVNSGNVLVTCAMEAAARGSYGDALNQLQELEESHNPADAKVWKAPLVQRLAKFCESQIGATQ